MRSLLGLIFIIIMVGCRIDKDREEREISTNPILIIDGCEYLTWDGSHGEVGITHKGNCNNPQHDQPPRELNIPRYPVTSTGTLRVDTSSIITASGLLGQRSK